MGGTQMETPEDFWGEPIHVYTEDQAVEDGFLVELGPKHRVTRGVFEWLGETLPAKGGPPQNFPIDLLGWCRAKTPDARAIAAANGLVTVNAQLAIQKWDAGDVMAFWPGMRVKDGTLGILHDAEPAPDWKGKVLWLLPNELGGVTLLFPEER